MERERLLLVEDDPDLCFGLRSYLEAQGFAVDVVGSLAAAQAQLAQGCPELVLCGHRLPDGNGLALLERMQAAGCTAPFIVLSGHGSIDLAVESLRLGAAHFLTKPLRLETVLVVVRRVIEAGRSRRVAHATSYNLEAALVDPFAGASTAAMATLRDTAARVARSHVPVLIVGETGTGKGALARWLHDRSGRSQDAFVDLHCAGLAPEQIEAELFGHPRSALASARPGLIETAHRGSLFLDEIGDLAPRVQTRLLEVLADQRFRRPGEVVDRRVSVRLLAASSAPPADRVGEQPPGIDVFHRLGTVVLRVPPLRERRADLPALVQQLLARAAARTRRTLSIAPAALERLVAYRWPGNLRELTHVLERAAILVEPDVDTVEPRHLGEPVAATRMAEPPPRTLAEIEREHVASVLAHVGGRVELAARWLDVPRSTLYQMIRRHGLPTRRSARAMVSPDPGRAAPALDRLADDESAPNPGT